MSDHGQLFEPTHVVGGLPGEPERGHCGFGLFVRLVARMLLVGLISVLTAPLWPAYWIGFLLFGRAPNVPRLSQITRYIGWAWTSRPPAPGLSALNRAWLTLSCLRKLAVTPVWGLAWMLDEVLYGRALRAAVVDAPLFEISAARSGSTQLARYIEEDPHILAPNLLQFVFPYLWLWRIVVPTLGRWVTKDAVRSKLPALVPPEYLERHEADPFRTDTFDAALYISHLNMIAPLLGPEVGLQEFNVPKAGANNTAQWCEDFVRLTDGICRKTLLFAGEAGQGRQLFVKGHFLAAADALAAHYPDARFFTVIRDPLARFQSAGNFLRANPFDPVLPPVPWTWVGEMLVDGQTRYCDVEQDWFCAADGPRRCVLRFDTYVADLPGTLQKLYAGCLDREVPDNLPTEHAARRRSGYMLNRSLAEMGIDEAGLKQRLSRYLSWVDET